MRPAPTSGLRRRPRPRMRRRWISPARSPSARPARVSTCRPRATFPKPLQIYFPICGFWTPRVRSASRWPRSRAAASARRSTTGCAAPPPTGGGRGSDCLGSRNRARRVFPSAKRIFSGACAAISFRGRCSCSVAKSNCSTPGGRFGFGRGGEHVLDGLEGADRLSSAGFDDGSDVGVLFCAPLGAEAVGDLSIGGAGAQ